MLSTIPQNELGIYQDVRNILNCVLGFLSLFGCLWIFYFYFKVTHNHPFSLKLILLLSSADLIFSLANIIAAFDFHSDLLCKIEGGMRNFSITSSLYFATSIAIWANYSFSRVRNPKEQQAFFKKILILGSIIPTLITLVPVILKTIFEYGHEPFGCYVVSSFSKPTSTDNMIILTIFYGIPIFAAISVTLAAYIKIAKKWNKLSKQLLINKNDIVVYKLFLYPAVLFISHSPSFVDDTINIYFPSTYLSFVLNIIHIILCHSMGFSNAFVYGYLRRKNYQVESEISIGQQSDPLDHSNISSFR